MADVFDFYVQDNRKITFEIAEPIMREDNGVTDLQFHVPKTLNGLDMTGWAWWFVFVNADKHKYTEPLVLTDDPERPLEYSVGTYTVDYGMSIKAGTVSFALEAINSDAGGTILNEWHTFTYQTTVKETLQGNQAEYSETESDIISALIVQIQQKYNSLVGGATPIPVASVSQMTDTSKIYLLTTDNNWYYYNGTAWVSGGLYASGIVIDPTLTRSGQAADAYETGVRFGENENSLSVVNELLDVETAESINRIDPDATTVGRYLYNGTFQTDSDYKTTDYIPVNTGDVLAFYKRIDAPSSAQRHTGERLALFDASKNYIGVSGQYPINVNTRYTVEDASARYIRLSYPASLGDVELVINLIVDQFTEYTPPHYTSKRLDNIERIAHQITPLKVIDCWGDSRTDMSDDGTSFCDYLGTLLGNTWIVSNRGISGQASGQVAARYGSNEIYLTLQNNKIAASGSTLITAYRVTTGTNTNLRGGDSTYGVHGILNGVSGKYIHTTGGNINFVRDYDGSEVKVKPNTKLIPDAYFNGSHCQILWCGKNDFPYAYPNVVAGIEGNYDGMVAKINHDKFLILGETYSIGSDYAEGTGNRDKVDTVNSDLLTKYPDNFIDIQAELIDKGLTLEGITPTSADTENISNGFIPDSLMFDSVHPNQYGREAIAKIIYAWMQNKGWV